MIKKLKNNIKLMIAIFFLIISAILFFININSLNIEASYYAYNIDENIDYKVYLKDNEFIEQKYLNKNNLYISSLVDYINIDFKYDFDASLLGDLSYNYDVIATLYIDYSNNQNLVTKEYPIIENKFLKLDNQNKINILESININYDSYNNEVTNFKNRFNLSITARLKVEFKINTEIDLDENLQTIYKDSTASVDIELNPSVFAITEKYTGKENKVLLEDEKNIVQKDIYLLLVSITVFLLSIIYILKTVFKFLIKIPNKNRMEKELNKILKKYSEIIIELKEEFKVNTTEILVKNFEELVDLENEIREPILFYKDENGSGIFLIINNGLVYKYILEL